jgi:hypothetical protein
MANPVAIYSPEPVAPPPRGGSASAQIIQIDVYRSGQRPRFDPDRDFQDSGFDDAPQTARATPLYADGGRAQAADTARRTGFNARTPNRRAGDGEFEAGRRRAPASLSFAAQQIAQEGLPPSVYFENFKPAIAAYVIAAERPNIPPPGQALEMTA